MPAVRTEREIDAPPHEVWSVLADFESYADWNPHVVGANASGPVEEGTTVDLTVDASGVPQVGVSATLTVVDHPRELEWVGSVVATPVFEGRHTFELRPTEDERTVVVNRERFGGVLPRILVSEDDTGDYEAMNEALAEEVQRRRDATATSAE